MKKNKGRKPGFGEQKGGFLYKNYNHLYLVGGGFPFL